MVPAASLESAETWTYKAWFRDFVEASATSNATDGLRVTSAH